MKPSLSCLGLGLLLSWSAAASDLTALADAAARYQSGASYEALQHLDLELARAAGQPPLQPALEAALIRLLQTDSTPEAKLFACQRLAITGSEAALPALAQLLQAPDTTARACLALANLPTPKANPVLREALARLSGSARVQVITTLGTRGDPEAAKPLAQLARDSDDTTANAAILALGKIAAHSVALGKSDTQAAKDTLADLRRSPPPGRTDAVDEVSLRLAEAYARRGNPKAAERLYKELSRPPHADHVRAGAFGARLHWFPKTAESTVVRLLRGEDRDLGHDAVLRPVAIAAAGRLQSAGAPKRLADCLTMLPPAEQAMLLSALADFGSRAPRAAMADLLSSPEESVRLAALQAFGRLNDPQDVPVFARALANAKTSTERQLAESALARLPGGSATDQRLLAELSNAANPAKPGLFAALARRGCSAALPVLLAATKAPEPAIARAAWQGLGRLARPADLDTLLDHALALTTERGDAAAALARVLGRTADEAARTQPVCSRLSAASDASARVFLLGLLPLAGGSEGLAATQAACRDTATSVADAARRALADWPTLAAWEALIALHADPAVSTTHRVLALRGLVRLALDEQNRSPKDALARHRQLLEAAQSDDDRKLVLGGLSASTQPEALDLVIPLLERAAIRAEAEQALRKIADAVKAAHPQAAQAALEKLAH